MSGKVREAGELLGVAVDVPETCFVVFAAGGKPVTGGVAVETDDDVTVAAEDANVVDACEGDDADVRGVGGKGEVGGCRGEVGEVDDFVVVAGEAAEGGEGMGEGVEEEGLVGVDREERGEGFVVSGRRGELDTGV